MTTPKPRHDGASLIPQNLPKAVVFERLFYWVGIFPSAPIQRLDVAGVHFSKGTEVLLPPDPGDTRRRRAPVPGNVVRLTRDQLDKFAEALSRTVIRVQPSTRKQEDGTGENVGDPHENAKATPITIPTEEQIAAAVEAKRTPRRYYPSPNDVPAATLVYMEPCVNQTPGETTGKHGVTMPPSLAETGIPAWPGDTHDETIDLIEGAEDLDPDAAEQELETETVSTAEEDDPLS